jgi:hypothetical protein
MLSIFSSSTSILYSTYTYEINIQKEWHGHQIFFKKDLLFALALDISSLLKDIFASWIWIQVRILDPTDQNERIYADPDPQHRSNPGYGSALT